MAASEDAVRVDTQTERADNQEVVHTSGLNRLCNSIFTAFVVAPLLLLAAVWLLGWNERSAVCYARALTEGEGSVVEVACNSGGDNFGKLVLWSCDLKQDNLTPFTLPGSTDFPTGVLDYVGTGLAVESQMKQCVETVTSTTEKDSVGGGTTTVKTYTYSVEWRSSAENDGAFKKNSQNWRDNCGVDNPAWPAEVPDSTTKYASSVKAGTFTLGSSWVREIPLRTVVQATSTPAGWEWDGTEYMSTKFNVSDTQIGHVKVSFKGTDWSRPVTVLGENGAFGMSEWKASDSWLCSDFGLGSLHTGVKSKSELFSNMRAGNNAILVLLRILGFLLIWFAMSRVFAPLGVVADCIPFVGPYIGDSIEAIACCITCPPACACALGVIGIVWVAMRPLVGVPLLLVFLLTCMLYGGWFARQEQKKMSKRAVEAAQAEAQGAEA